MRFARIAFGCDVVEGYGQTECIAGATMTVPGEVTAGMLSSHCCISRASKP